MRKKRLLFVTNYLTPNQVSFFSQFSEIDVRVVAYSTPDIRRPWGDDAPAGLDFVRHHGWMAPLHACRHVLWADRILVGGSLRSVVAQVVALFGRLSGRKVGWWLEAPDRSSWRARMFVRLSLKSGCRILAIGLGALTYYRATFHAYRDRVHLFPYTYGARSPLLGDDGGSADVIDAPTVLCVATDWERKGVQDFVDAIARVRDRWSLVAQSPGAGLPTGVIVGLSTTPIVLPAGVVFVGKQSHSTTMEWVARSTVLVMSSRVEGWGVVSEEALELGTPVVATDAVGAVGLTVVDGVNGAVVPPRDPEALSEAILSLLSDPTIDRRDALSGLLTSFRRRYSPDRIFELVGR